MTFSIYFDVINILKKSTRLILKELIFTNALTFLFAHLTQHINVFYFFPGQCGLLWGFVYKSSGEKGKKKKEKSNIGDYWGSPTSGKNIFKVPSKSPGASFTMLT